MGIDFGSRLAGTLSTTFVYDPENRLVSASGQNNVDLRYDPFGRLYQVTDSTSNITRFHYDGDALIGEYNASGTQLQRYIHGPGPGPGAGDDPLIRYPGSSSARSDAHYFYADRLGSIVQEVKRDGTVTAINSYDAYGIPGASSGINNQGRFRYTGQTWIAELGMYYYKARMYSPTLGRFMQTDPIGYSDGMNIYAYVGNDPLNGVDPSGLRTETRCKKIRVGLIGYETTMTICTDIEIPDAPTEPIVPKRSPAGGGGGAPQNDRCVKKGSDGRCQIRRSKDGKIYMDPEEEKKICADFDKIMQSNSEVSDLAAGGAGVAAIDALTGGRLPILRNLGRFTATGGAIFISGVATVTTRLLSSVEKPSFCPQ